MHSAVQLESWTLPGAGWSQRCVLPYTTKLLKFLLQNQAIDLQFWAEWHRSVGVSRIYLWDHGSSVPMSPAVQDLIDDGYIQYTWFSDTEPAHDEPAQFFVYNRLAAGVQCPLTTLMSWFHCPPCTTRQHSFCSLKTHPAHFPCCRCIEKYASRHRFLAFLDVDEFLVLRDRQRFPMLPDLLRNYESFGGDTRLQNPSKTGNKRITSLANLAGVGRV